MDEESAKAVQEVAKTAGQLVTTGEKLGSFVARFISGTLEQVSGIVEDRFKYMRWERQQRLMLRAEEFMRRKRMAGPSRPVPLSLALPLFEAASLEENDELQDRFAALLVNAADGNAGFEVRRAFVSMLEQLSPVEARILDLIYRLPPQQARAEGVRTTLLPMEARISQGEFDESGLSDDIALALANLERLGCLRAGLSWKGAEIYERVTTTVLGAAFAAACRPPTEDSEKTG